jgi:hypothetical protein
MTGDFTESFDVEWLFPWDLKHMMKVEKEF